MKCTKIKIAEDFLLQFTNVYQNELVILINGTSEKYK